MTHLRLLESQKKAPFKFEITKFIHKMELATFDLNDPESLAQFAPSDEDEEETLSTLSTTEDLNDDVEGDEDEEEIDDADSVIRDTPHG